MVGIHERNLRRVPEPHVPAIPDLPAVMEYLAEPGAHGTTRMVLVADEDGQWVAFVSDCPGCGHRPLVALPLFRYLQAREHTDSVLTFRCPLGWCQRERTVRVPPKLVNATPRTPKSRRQPRARKGPEVDGGSRT